MSRSIPSDSTCAGRRFHIRSLSRAGSGRRSTLSISVAFATLALAAAWSPGAAAPDDALDALVAAERAFSAMSVEHNMRDAFLEYMTEDAILFRPLPVNGRSVWKDRPGSKATLIWEPSHAELAAAGDLGWTTGPWEVRPPPDSTGAPSAPDTYAHGHFTTVWGTAGWPCA